MLIYKNINIHFMAGKIYNSAIYSFFNILNSLSDNTIFAVIFYNLKGQVVIFLVSTKLILKNPYPHLLLLCFSCK